MGNFNPIERSIITKFRKTIWQRFIHGVTDYDLVQAGDKIAVCISGGKDSMLLAKCMQELQRHGNRPFDVEFIVMNPGYSEENEKKIIENAQKLDIPIKMFSSQIFAAIETLDNSACYLCARMRRGYLYEFAKSLGCNKIALGHHFDDAVETILLSMLYGAEYKTMMPKLKSTSHPGMQLIRPLYLVREEDIVAWAKYNGLSFLRCACRITKNCESEGSKRAEIKNLLKQLKAVNPMADANIFRSIHSVNLETVIGYRKGEERHSFLEEFDDFKKTE